MGLLPHLFLPSFIPTSVPRSNPFRPYTILTGPPEFSAWRIRCGLGDAPTLESMQAAIADVERTTMQRLRRARNAGLLEEAAYWQDILEHQLDALRHWQKPRRRRGKPKGKGAYFKNRQEFVTVLRLAMRHVYTHNRPVTKTKVARIFHHIDGGYRTSYRTLQTWLVDRFKVDWEELLASIQDYPPI
jgi:hypothetical protein